MTITKETLAQIQTHEDALTRILAVTICALKGIPIEQADAMALEMVQGDPRVRTSWVTLRASSLTESDEKAIGVMSYEHEERLPPKGPLYSVWLGMRRRCNSKNDRDYPNYGGRGIAICKEWDSYAVFLEWATSNGYMEGLTIDRENNDGPYSPDNCRWATRKVQTLNRRKTVHLEYNGVKMSLSEWAVQLGIKHKTLYSRVKRGVWSIKDAIEKPSLGRSWRKGKP